MLWMNYRLFLAFSCCLAVLPKVVRAAEDSVETVTVWPDAPPAWTEPEGAELNTSGPDSRTVAGPSVIRLGNVSRPQLNLYPA